MAKPFDAATKYLIESRPSDWLALAGFPAGLPVQVIDADLATVTSEADRVLRVNADPPWLAHLELQASHDADLAGRMLHYNVLLQRRHHLPVWSLVVLLRPEAGRRETGTLERRMPDGRAVHLFHYGIVRAWRLPVEDVMAGGLGTLPLAPISDVPRQSVVSVVARMEARIEREADPAQAGQLWTAAYVLLGLRYAPEMASRLMRGVRTMRESSTYQAILEEGEARGVAIGEANAARNLLLRLGAHRFGDPDASTRARIEALPDAARLSALAERLLDVESWDELLRG